MAKKIISLVLCLILIVFILLSQVGFFISNVVFNKNLYEKVLSNYNVSNEIYAEYIDSITNFTKSRNLPESVFQDVINEKDVSVFNSNNIIFGIDYLRGKAEEVSQNDPTEKLNKIMGNVRAYVDTLEGTESQDTEAIEKELVKIERGYQNIIIPCINAVSIKFLFLINPENISQIKVVETLSNLSFVFVIVSIALVALIYFLNKNNITRGLSLIGYSSFIAGILTFSPGFTGNFSKFYTKIPMVGEYINQIVTGVLDQFFEYFMKTGLCLLIVGFIFLVVGFVIIIKKDNSQVSQ